VAKVKASRVWNAAHVRWATFRQPFDIIAVSNIANEKQKAAGVTSNGHFENWLLGQDSNLQPAGYKCPGISPGLGLSLHLPHRSGVKVSGAREALLDGFLSL